MLLLNLRRLGFLTHILLTWVTGQGQKRTADAASSQAQSKAKQGTSAPESYAAAVTGKSEGNHIPIGAKTVKAAPAKVPAKYASGAIGAPAPAKPPPKAPTETPVAGARGAGGTSQTGY